MGACLSNPFHKTSSSRDSEAPAESNPTEIVNDRRNTFRDQSKSTTTTAGKDVPGTSRGNIDQSLHSIDKSEDSRLSKGTILASPNLKAFTYAELKKSTKGFRPESFLGEGGFGKVYKGWVDEKTLGPSRSGNRKEIAVKKLNASSMQGREEWRSEIAFLGRLSHPNLVKLLGYCSEGEELMLVYEFMSRGSLESHLFQGGEARDALAWRVRLKIALDVAQGLSFLHSLGREIIYRDLKVSNILLDWEYNAKLTDFGLAKEGPQPGESHVSTRVFGTYGYLAPEYATMGHLYVKSDVYGFGVLLLELLSGQRVLDERRPFGQENLISWAKPFLADFRKFAQIMDPGLGEHYSPKAAFEICQLANRCLAREPKNRPSMHDVEEILLPLSRR